MEEGYTLKVDPVVKNETRVIALGVAVLCLLMLAVFAFIKQLDYTVIIGTCLGFLAAVANFFLMAFSVQKSAEKMNGVQPAESMEETAEDGEEEQKEAPLSPEAKLAKKFMQASYTGRMLLLVIVAILAISLPFINAIPCLIALLFPRIVIYVTQIIRNKKEARA